MSAKHTPGPWSAQRDQGSIQSDDWLIGAQGRADSVAVCSERNAALIAAAPDMLQALHEMLCHIQDPDERDFLDANKFKWQQEAFRKAHAAIARATGQ